MGLRRITILLCGSLAMFLLIIARRKIYTQINILKRAILSFWLTVSGVLGAMFMFYIEKGSFGGTSFFGAILFVPIIILPMLLLKIKYTTLLDLSAPEGCLMLAIMKIDCLMAGCCSGKYLTTSGIRFPSQIVEMITTLIIMAILLKMEKNEKYKDIIYSWYLILYGATRFVLNWFRYGLKPFVWVLPAGNFWSIIAVLIGCISMCFIKFKKNKA